MFFCLFIQDDPQVVCNLLLDKGQCRGLAVRWHYNKEKKECAKFNFGGCGGNANNFRNAEECTKFCVGTYKIFENISVIR